MVAKTSIQVIIAYFNLFHGGHSQIQKGFLSFMPNFILGITDIRRNTSICKNTNTLPKRKYLKGIRTFHYSFFKIFRVI